MTDEQPAEQPGAEPGAEQEDPGVPEEPPGPRRYPSTIGGAFYLGVLAVAMLGLVLVGVGANWRIGIRVLACSLGVAGVLRLVLPEKDAGMLAVRNRWLDVAILFVVGAALFFLSITIPNQPV